MTMMKGEAVGAGDSRSLEPFFPSSSLTSYEGKCEGRESV